MRTTLELDDDILVDAKALASERGESLGHVISDLARAALRTKSQPKMRNGVPLFTPTNPAAHPDLDFVNSLRDEG